MKPRPFVPGTRSFLNEFAALCLWYLPMARLTGGKNWAGQFKSSIIAYGYYTMFGPGRNKNFQNFAMGAGIRQNKKRIDKKTDFLYSVLIAFASEKGRLPKEVGRPIKAALFFRRKSFFGFCFLSLV